MINAPEGYRYDLFVAHARDDAKWVKGCLLAALGLPQARVITEADFRPGAPLVSEYERAVVNARFTVLILTPAYLSDNWAALGENLVSYLSVQEQQQRVVPLLLRQCDAPLRIGFRVALDCTDEANWQTELGRLRALLEVGEPARSEIECPYPGMVPFRAEDERFFHGREAEIERMLKHLRHERFLLVIGPSGSGKSSLITAGLRPRLAKSGYFKQTGWHVQQFRPGPHPYQTLAEALCADPDRLADAVAALLAANPPATRLLLIIDQFEEVFSQAEPTEQKRLMAALKAVRDLETCTLIIAMRSDFYDDLMRSDLAPIDASQRLEVFPLKGEALRQAIERPALAKGVYLETKLEEALLADAAEEPGALPMLQETLVQLWDMRQASFLPFSAYEKFRVGSRSGLAVAMTVKADATLAGLSTSQQDIARRLFLRLVQFGEGRVDTRRQQPVSQLRSVGDDPADFEKTLTVLVDNRLLTLDAERSGGNEHRVDIAHEALFTGWPRLAEWIAERREAEQTRRQLEDKAKEWQRLGRGTGGLLDAVELKEARQWLEGPDAPVLRYTKILAQHIEASQKAFDAAEQEKEAIHQREVEDARRLEAAKQQRITVVIALVGVLAVFILTSVLILWRLGVAQAVAAANQSRNESLRLTATAEERLVSDPVVSLEYAARALPQSPDDQRPYISPPEFVLRQALERSLERRYIAIPGELFSAQQIDVDGPAIAVGAKMLNTLSPDLNPTTQATLTGHTSLVQGVKWGSEDELISFDTGTIRVWRNNAQTAQRVFAPASIEAVALRPGHPELALCTDSGQWLWAYDQGDLQQVGGLTGCSGSEVSSPLRWSADGSKLAAWDQSGALALWDSTSGKATPLSKLDNSRYYLEVAWSPDGQHLVALANDLKIRVWSSPEQNPAPREYIGTNGKGQDGVIAGLVFVDDERFVVWGWDDQAELWSVDGKPLRSYAPHAGSIRGVKLAPDGTRLLTFMATSFYQWPIEGGDSVAFEGHTNRVLDADWRGSYLVTGSYDGTARVWDAQTGKELVTLHASTLSSGPRADVILVRWQPDGHLLTAGDDGTLRLWQIFDNRGMPVCAGTDVSGEPRCFANSLTMAGPEVAMKQAHWTAQDTVAGNDARGVIWRWDLKTDELQSVPVAPAEQGRRSVAWSPDGKGAFVYPGSAGPGQEQAGGEVWSTETMTMTRSVPGSIIKAFWLDAGLLVAYKDGTLRLLDPATGAELSDLPGPWHDISDAQAHENRLAVAGTDTSLRIFDWTTGKLLADLSEAQPSSVKTVQWLGDGKLLLTAGTSVKLWDAETGKLVRRFESPDGYVSRPAISPGDQQYVAAGIGDTLYVWDVRDGKVVWSKKEPATAIAGVHWTFGRSWGSKEPRLLLLAGSGGTAHVWDWNSEEFEIMRMPDTAPINTAIASNDGEWVLTVSEGGAVRAWHAWLKQPELVLEAAKGANTRPSPVSKLGE